MTLIDSPPDELLEEPEVWRAADDGDGTPIVVEAAPLEPLPPVPVRALLASLMTGTRPSR